MVEDRESITAKLCSFARAYHSNYDENTVFNDYLAYDLMGRAQYEQMGKLIESDFSQEKANGKTWFYQENIREAVYNYMLPIPISRLSFAKKELHNFVKKYSKESGKIQYVICGAGMDSFAFRNTNENIQIFEIDHPDTQKYKKARINELEWITPKNLTFVPVDFTRDSLKEKLLENGFNPSLPTFTAILGVSYYLRLKDFEQTLNTISSLTNNESKIIFDFPDETTLSKKAANRVRDLAQITAKLGEPMLKGFSKREIKGALRRNALKIENHEKPKDIQKNYFSGKNENLKAFENVHFISACKRKRRSR